MSPSSSTSTLADPRSTHEILNFSNRSPELAQHNQISEEINDCQLGHHGCLEPSDVVTSARSFVLSGLARTIQDAIVLKNPAEVIELILRLLEHLTKAVTKISQASTNRKTGDNTTDLPSTIEVESETIQL
ncbi:hypothetical protein MJO28_010443 [Puccinia striiformis f. sp. tritici]|uniref:Uncharacterized protein n=1 Tax=Puccinia striiformis f. sp. tritici TaxID=168172 RepID=A0ACC0E6H3_9BASI|nr:hypothetical protein MJO28_010443 [Puccinia striiformis f. sp. tritici]